MKIQVVTFKIEGNILKKIVNNSVMKCEEEKNWQGFYRLSILLYIGRLLSECKANLVLKKLKWI